MITGQRPVIRNAKTMATIDIHNLSGEKVGTFDLADEIFGAVNEDLLWEAVKHYRAGQRAGTHKTKARREVSGSGKKLWKQKGTGRARIGSIRSPLWRHGYTVHGPQPRSYDYTFPKKKLLGALRSALASKFADGKLIVVNAFDVKEPKTKEFQKALDALRMPNGKPVLYLPAGTYRITRTLKLVRESHNESKDVSILGEDPATTLLRDRNGIAQLRRIDSDESTVMLVHDSPSLFEALPGQSG